MVDGVGKAWSNTASTTIVLETKPILNPSSQTPQDKAVGVSKTPTFTWESSDINGDSIEYYIRIGESATNLNYKSGWITDIKEFKYSDRFDTPLKPNTTYYWQIQYREANRDSDYYGGEYPVSDVWSFTTVGVGADLAITDIKRVGDVAVDEWIPFEVTIKNNGTEVAPNKSLKPFFIKNGEKLEFKSYKHGYMSKDLAVGEEETVIVQVKFSNQLETKTFTRYDGTTYTQTFDNILIDGDNSVKIEIENNNFDINPANDSKDTIINYSMATNLPTINDVHIVKNNLSTERGDYRYMLGWKVTYKVNASDAIKIDKVDLEYRTSIDDEWHFIQSYSNYNANFYQELEWTIPDSVENITQTMQIRAKIYNPSGAFTSAVSPELKVFENNLGVNDIYVDNTLYKTGNPIIVSYDSFSKNEVEEFKIYLDNNGFTKTLLSYKKGDGSTFNPTSSLKFTIPTDTRIIGTNVKVKFNIKDINGAYKDIYSNPFEIQQNTQTPQEFSDYQDVYTDLYNNFPTNSREQKTSNNIVKIVIDDNGLEHLLISQIASWWGEDSSGHTTYSNRNFRYLYLTYNPKTKAKSSAQLMFENNIIDNGNLPDEKYLDFIVNGSTAIMLTSNTNTQIIKKYQLVGTVSSEIVASYNYAKLINYNNKTYIYYSTDETIVEDRRLKRREVYPNLGTSENIFDDEYLGSYIRVHNDLLYFYEKGIFFQVDSNFKVIVNTKKEIGIQNKYLAGNVDIYDSSVKEVLLDENYNIVLLKEDNSKEMLFDIRDSVDANRSYQRVSMTLAVYSNQIIMAYEERDTNKYKIITYNRDTKQISSSSLGSRVNGSNATYSEIVIDKNKNIIIGNPDGRYDPSAQLVTADLTNSLSSVPIVTLKMDKEVKFNTSTSIDWELSSDNGLSNFQVYKISKGVVSLLSTITDTSIRTYTYTPIDNNEKFVTFKIVANYIGGGSYYDIASINIIGDIVFNSFSTDVTELYLNQEITFNWEVEGDSNEYTLYRQCDEETTWTSLFSTNDSYKKYKVEDFIGTCKIKIVSGSSEKILDYPIIVYGNIFRFKENSLIPSGSYTPSKGIFEFKWDTWFDIFSTNSDYTLLIKKQGELDFSKIDSTLNKSYTYSGDLGSSFDWKVSFDNDGETIESEIIHVNVLDINIPTIITAKFDINDSQKFIKLEYSSVADATFYDIYRTQYNNKFEKIETTEALSYIDKDISYGETYQYYVIAQKGKDVSKPSQVVNVDAIKVDKLLENEIMDLLIKKTVTISLKQIDDISVSMNDTISPITIEGNASNGEALSYQVSSSNSDIVVANMYDNSLSLTLIENAIGEANITIMANVGDSSLSMTFKVTVQATPLPTPITISLSLKQIDNISVNMNDTIAPITIEGNASNGEALTYQVSSSNSDIVVANMYDNILSLTLVENAIGEANITIMANVGDSSLSMTFKVKVNTHLEDEVNIDTLESYSVDDTEILFGKTYNDFLIYNLKKSLKTTIISVKIIGSEVSVDSTYNTTITIPIQNMSLLVDKDGNIENKMEGFLLPKNNLPLGTEVTVEETKALLIVPIIDKLEF